MDPLKEYLIPFYGLKDGQHSYTFELEKSFFDEFPYGEIQEGKVTVHVELTKRLDMLTLDFILDGQVTLVCDRCGDDYDQPVKGDRQLVVNLNADRFDDEDDLIALPASVHEINIAQWLYEFVTLLLPARRVHPDKAVGAAGCDPEMLARLQALAVQTNQHEQLPGDSRWNALKNLKFDQ